MYYLYYEGYGSVAAHKVRFALPVGRRYLQSDTKSTSTRRKVRALMAGYRLSC